MCVIVSMSVKAVHLKLIYYLVQTYLLLASEDSLPEEENLPQYGVTMVQIL